MTCWLGGEVGGCHKDPQSPQGLPEIARKMFKDPPRTSQRHPRVSGDIHLPDCFLIAPDCALRSSKLAFRLTACFRMVWILLCAVCFVAASLATVMSLASLEWLARLACASLYFPTGAYFPISQLVVAS